MHIHVNVNQTKLHPGYIYVNANGSYVSDTYLYMSITSI